MAVKWKISPDQIAGIMGNMRWEGDFSPYNAQDSFGYPDRNNSESSAYPYVFDSIVKEVGFGLCQWSALSRKSALAAFAIKRGTGVWDMITQLEFMKYEMSECKEYTTYNKVWGEILSADSRSEVTRIMFDDYEECKDKSLGSRQRYADSVYKSFYSPEFFEFYNNP